MDFKSTIYKKNRPDDTNSATDTPKMAPVKSALKPRQDLTPSDRCDVGDCGAQALYRVIIIESDSELIFCSHHYNSNETSLASKNVEVQDFRYLMR